MALTWRFGRNVCACQRNDFYLPHWRFVGQTRDAATASFKQRAFLNPMSRIRRFALGANARDLPRSSRHIRMSSMCLDGAIGIYRRYDAGVTAAESTVRVGT